jgi:hypothetical protein
VPYLSASLADFARHPLLPRARRSLDPGWDGKSRTPKATKIRIAALVWRVVCECDGDFHMRAMSVLALAALSVAGMAEAQTGTEQMTNQPSQAQSPVRTAPDGSFKDECGFRYNNRGDRIDARGRVLPPPATPPNGRSCK